jgi:hypothetical protein
MTEEKVQEIEEDDNDDHSTIGGTSHDSRTEQIEFLSPDNSSDDNDQYAFYQCQTKRHDQPKNDHDDPPPRDQTLVLVSPPNLTDKKPVEDKNDKDITSQPSSNMEYTNHDSRVVRNRCMMTIFHHVCHDHISIINL